MNRFTSRATIAHRGAAGPLAGRATATRFDPTQPPGINPDESGKPMHATVLNDEDHDPDGLDYLVPIPKI
jgi:hypothetical protein